MYIKHIVKVDVMIEQFYWIALDWSDVRNTLLSCLSYLEPLNFGGMKK